MKRTTRKWLLRLIAAVYSRLNQHIIFRQPAQAAHEAAIGWLRALERLPFSASAAALLRQLTLPTAEITVGGACLPQRLILAAGLVKGDGFTDETEALRAVAAGRNIMPGWRILPALVGAVEFGSFTRQPRLGNAGTVVWRDKQSQSTQNRVGLRNPGARAAARFLAQQGDKLPPVYGINIAVSPGLADIAEQGRDSLEALAFFLEAGLRPTWFTLNISCPNTEDDPQGLQLETETRRLCAAFIARLRGRDIPLWVKISPGLAAEQYETLMRVFHEVGVQAVVATNTWGQPSPEDDAVVAGVGGGRLFEEALKAIEHLQAAKIRHNYAVDLIACGGILDGPRFRAYAELGVAAGQYWSALVYRGPFAAAIIESEIAKHAYEYKTLHRQSLA